VAKDIYIAASKGVKNSLPESTIDMQATTQQTSAYLFHKVGEAVQAQTLAYQLNGNTIKSVKMEDGSAMQTGDCGIEGASIKFSNSFLGRYFTPTLSAGPKASLTIQFSAGADSRVQLVQWDAPKLAGGASSKAVSGKDLSLPVTWKGIQKIATVKVVLADGKYLVDDWTQYLGPLQKARAVRFSFQSSWPQKANNSQTYNSQWKWDAKNLIITTSAVNAVVQAGKSATFTFEFWPRVAGNSLNYTLTV